MHVAPLVITCGGSCPQLRISAGKTAGAPSPGRAPRPAASAAHPSVPGRCLQEETAAHAAAGADTSG